MQHKSETDWERVKAIRESEPIPYEPEDGPYDPNDAEAARAWLANANRLRAVQSNPQADVNSVRGKAL
jgi:hypothetical protein